MLLQTRLDQSRHTSSIAAAVRFTALLELLCMPPLARTKHATSSRALWLYLRSALNGSRTTCDYWKLQRIMLAGGKPSRAEIFPISLLTISTALACMYLQIACKSSNSHTIIVSLLQPRCHRIQQELRLPEQIDMEHRHGLGDAAMYASACRMNRIQHAIKSVPVPVHTSELNPR